MNNKLTFRESKIKENAEGSNKHKESVNVLTTKSIPTDNYFLTYHQFISRFHCEQYIEATQFDALAILL